MKISKMKEGHWYTVQLQNTVRVLKFERVYDNYSNEVVMIDTENSKWVFDASDVREMTFHESAELLKELLQKLGNQLIDFIMELIEKVIDVAIAFIKAYIKFFYKTYGYYKCKIRKKHTWQWIDEKIECEYEENTIGYIRVYECKHCGRLKTRIEVL